MTASQNASYAFSEGRKRQAQREKQGVKGFTPSELAAYLGTTTRTIRRWRKASLIPEPELRSESGWAIWTVTQAKEIREWLLKQR